jgi:hypothetical protein
VAEELVLQQGLRDGRAIVATKGPFARGERWRSALINIPGAALGDPSTVASVAAARWM